MNTDSELVRAWRAGDRQSGNALFERHFDSIRRFFRNKVEHGVEDLVQRTFMGCLEAKDRFREDASFRTFLFAIAHNVLREHYRRARRSTDELDLERLSIIDLGVSPSSLLAARAEEKLLLHALRQLPVAGQVILELYYWEDMTGAELGLFLGVPEDTARSRLRKAKKQLEEAMTLLASSPSELESTLAGLDRWAALLRAGLAR